MKKFPKLRIKKFGESSNSKSPETVESDPAQKKNEFKRTSLKELIQPDGVNPLNLDHTIISDGGTEVFIRCFYVRKLPTNATFGVTFQSLIDFPNSVSKFIVYPKTRGESVNEMNKELTNIRTEVIDAKKKGDENKIRTDTIKLSEGERTAIELDADEEKLFDVKMLFAIEARSLEELNVRTTEFHNLAISSTIEISAFYGRHHHAYKLMFPDNITELKEERSGKGFLVRFEKAAIEFILGRIPSHRFNIESLSTLYHQTTTEFYHADGIPIGRNRITHNLVTYDFYAEGHFGFSIVIAGKTNSGKGTLIKKLINLNRLVHGMNFVAVDTEEKNGEGEYCPITRQCNGQIYALNPNSETVFGLFDIEPTLVYHNDGTVSEELDLANKKALVRQILIIKQRGDVTNGKTTGTVTTQHTRIIEDVITELYNEKGIYHGEIDSLYVQSEDVYDEQRAFVSGRKKKEMPTITDAFIKGLKKQKRNKDPEYSKAYSDFVSMLPTYIRELNICEECYTKFTKEEFRALDKIDGEPYCPHCGKEHIVKSYAGTRPYFDGQTNVIISPEVPFTNIDMSKQDEGSKYISLMVMMLVILEYFVKKNATRAEYAKPLGIIWDELKKVKPYPEIVDLIDLLYRICRKRYVAMITATQMLSDYDGNLKSLVSQATSVFVFRHESDEDKKYIKKSLRITDSEAESCIGAGVGECLLYDTTGVALVQVEALDVEKHVVYSDAYDTYEADKPV